MFAETVSSPLVNGAPAKLIRTLPSAEIINGYRTEYDVDVTEYFRETEFAAVYECQVTGYQFYYPFSLVGTESLYVQLERSGWYKTKKWEYETTLRYLPRGARVLDVGSGPGAFLKLAAKAGLAAQGIELNASAARAAREEGLEVEVELISDRADKAPEKYDAVCSFQVLEHIADVEHFISDCIRALKPGGLLIFGVPNNDSFLRYAHDAVLNQPPHHMGLWSSKSLAALPTVFPLELKSIEREPIAEIGWYAAVMERRYLKNRWVRAVYYRLGGNRLFSAYVAKRAHSIPGHTILAVYQKNRQK